MIGFYKEGKGRKLKKRKGRDDWSAKTNGADYRFLWKGWCIMCHVSASRLMNAKLRRRGGVVEIEKWCNFGVCVRIGIYGRMGGDKED
ncbi:unnamed protein product [Dovyalis caffra]|uniref:Uncharacterized protein n=1 Tax=Dovyalis caffra TaxID=77055 RepID=A0AAV1S6C0_9ROSI|nr:unnamed protein product [Dovyalis caffra]